MADEGDLFGDSSDEADTDDLIATSKTKAIAKKKGGDAKKKPVAKDDKPDADNDLDDSDNEIGTTSKTAASSGGGLFDSSDEEDDDAAGGGAPKKLGKKKKATKPAKPSSKTKSPSGPPKSKMSMKERMEALAKKRAAADGSGTAESAPSREKDAKEPKKKRPKTDGKSKGGEGKNEDDLHNIISGQSKAANDVGNNRVRVPYSKGFQFTVRPMDRTGNVADKRNLVSASKDNDKRNALSKRMTEKQRPTNKQGQRSANISIEGRAVK